MNSHPIEVTKEAATYASEQLARRGKGVGVRLGVKASGCSGLSYTLEFVDKPSEFDQTMEQHGVNFYVDAKSLVYLSGARLELTVEGVNSGLTFTNPNATNSCGCGESFSI